MYVSFSSCVDKNSFIGFNFHVWLFNSHYFLTFAQLSQDLIQPYITSLTSMKAEQTIETAKDSSGARVIEAFLASNAATKQKRKLINKYALLFYVIWLFYYFMNDRFHSVALFI